MEISQHPLTDKEKEHCAVTTMRHMLENYSTEKNISFEEAFFRFTNSKAYLALFDYETGIWGEGPDYLMVFFETCLKNN